MKILSHLIDAIRAFFGKRSVLPNSCITKYPILLVHGIAYRDDMPLPSWGRVPDYLRKGGAEVFLANTDAWASYMENGKIIKESIEQILKDSDCEKVNIIAHSKGGIDSRYAISAFQLDDKVASLTTISSPHRGTSVADVVTKLISEENNMYYQAVDCLGRLMGDKHPETSKAVSELTRNAMQQFNEKHPNSPKIFYQSYGSQMKNSLNDPVYAATFPLVKKYEGENDGMISTNSCQWGEFKGIVESKLPGIGISHLQITGAVFDVIAGENIPLFYVNCVSELKHKGF